MIFFYVRLNPRKKGESEGYGGGGCYRFPRAQPVGKQFLMGFI